MRNLKRALSMALATVMLMGMTVVGASAANFSDVSVKEHNVEAIELMKAADIMVGDQNGNFNPDQKVTRNEMAVVICKMLGLDADEFEGVELPFTDVPAWAAPYVAACYAEGIVAGTSATTYGGAASVKAVEAALMTMKTLGYFQFQSDFGNNWSYETAKMAGKLDLFEGIEAGLQTALTRNEVAQLIMNTLMNETVEGEGDSGFVIEGNGITITNPGNKATYEKTGDTLMEELFGDRFEKKATTTDLGIPAIKWVDTEADKDEQTVVVIAEEADEIVVADADTTTDELYKAEVDKDAKNVVAKDIDAGDVAYYFEGEDAIDVVVVDYQLVQIDEIDDNMNKTEIKNGHEFEIKLDNGKKFYDDEFAGFDYDEGDYVLVAYALDGETIADSELAETFDAEIDRTKGDEVRIDGTYYVNLTGEALKIGDEFTAVLDKAGNIILAAEIVEDETASGDYAYIYNVTTKAGDEEYDEDGNLVTEDAITYAYVILADGSKEKYVVEEDSKVEKNTVVAYSINKDGEFVVEKANEKVAENLTVAELSKDTKFVTIDGDRIYANSKTEFVFFAKNDKGIYKTSTVTGVANVEIENTVVNVIYDKAVELVFVEAAEAEVEVESDAMFAVLLNTECEVALDEDDNELYIYSVAIDGEEDELTFEAELTIDAGDVFTYTLTNDETAKFGAELTTKGTIDYVGEDFFTMTETGAEEFTAEDAEIYTITIDVDGDISVEDEGKLDEETVFFYTANKNNEIEMAFILVVETED